MLRPVRRPESSGAATVGCAEVEREARHLRRLMAMRKIRTIYFALLLLAATITEAASISVLFVGNSLTQVNDLPTAFKKFAGASVLHFDVDVSSIAPGGAFLSDHWKRGDVVARLRSQHPNFLILQGQSTEPLSAPKNFAYYAGLFKTEADRVHTTTVLFSTWARPTGDPYYKDATSGGSPAEMQARLNSAYASLAQSMGATLAPVGVAWERAHNVAPKLELLDGTQHPSPIGTYLAAAVLFETVFKTSAVGSTYYGTLPQPTAQALQRIADAVR
jgi:hypothetical protein